MSLTGAQVQELQDALVKAFDQGALLQMARVHLDENLFAVAGGNSLNDVVFNLIAWAERTGRTADLIAGALAYNPQNPELKAFEAKYFAAAANQPLTALMRPQLVLSLANVDSEGYAAGEWTSWGEGGSGTYFYHVSVTNQGSEPAKDVWVELKTVSKLDKHGRLANTLSRRLPLRKPGDGEERAPGYIRAYDDSTWNFGYLARHLNQFQLDIYIRDWPLNFQGIVKANGQLQVGLIAIAENARSELMQIDIFWDGSWVDDDSATMRQHLKVRELRSFFAP